MISKRSNAASAKGRDIAPGVPAQKGSVMENASDNGRLADATGLSSASPIEPVPVSPVLASIPSACKFLLSGMTDEWTSLAKLSGRLNTRHFIRPMRELIASGLAEWSWGQGQSCKIYRLSAQAIEARRAETHSRSVADESAVPEGCAQGDSA